ncbi:HABP4-PAI-RBP1 domain-containing protein [Mycena chlorophos]|uniref:HABP4-PAI-RBP1 domain-containing protein n=1 Tax=Mycena chlorophos TaxID=658473 RepID=A0A8H6T6M9_MYCCL|nr:HABP4-PAI-RBP1 domain-containing protein [Mycena chlorophos]
MSVATKNPFALLEAEDASRPSSPVAAPAAAAAAAPASRGTPKTRGGPASRGGKYYARGGKPPARDGTSGNPNQNGIEDAPQNKKVDGRGRGASRGGSRGGPRGGRGRQFDKHSQTGKVDSDKKINQGWGAEEGNAELKAEQAAATDAAAEATPAGGDWGAAAGDAGDWAAPAAADGAAPTDKPEGRPRREREPEEEDNTLTLDQYMAQQKEKDSAAVPKLEGVRKVNDGADAWKDVVALEKGDTDSYFVGKTKAAPKARAKKDEKVFIEIDARFERPSRGGPRGGGRGGDRGGRGGAGRGRGAPRGGRPTGGAASASFDVDDEKAFPSLA